MKKNIFCSLLITTLLAAVLFFIGDFKSSSGFHVDETYSFGLSNHQYSKSKSITLNFNDGKIYCGKDILPEYLSTKNNKKFDYKNVLVNQSHDVHPPLYYIILHTVSSIFSEASYKHLGLMVNIPVSCVIFWQLFWLARKLDVGQYSALILSASYILSIGFIGYSVVFFRMYALMAVWINFLAMLFFIYAPEEKATIRYSLTLCVILICGTLTQYYFLIYSFLICSVYAFFVIKGKNWQKLISSLSVSIVAAVVSIILFRPMIRHIFESYRGKEALKNTKSLSHLWENMWKLLDAVNAEVFAKLFIVIFVVMICLLISHKKNWIRQQIYKYSLLILPSILYVMVIAKIAPYMTLRYIIPICGVLYIALFSGMIYMAQDISLRSGKIILLLACFISVTGYRYKIPNMNLGDDSKIAQLQSKKDSPCIVLYNSSWKLLPNFSQFQNFDKVIFIKEKSWEKYKDKKLNIDANSLIVYLDKKLNLNHENVLNILKGQYQLKSSKKLFEHGYSKVYYLK